MSDSDLEGFSLDVVDHVKDQPQQFSRINPHSKELMHGDLCPWSKRKWKPGSYKCECNFADYATFMGGNQL